MIDPKELEDRTVRAVRGAGRHWESLDAQTQAMLVEVANELLRSPLRNLAIANRELENTRAELGIATYGLRVTSEAKERYKASTQALLGQLSDASILSSEMMAIVQSRPFELISPRPDWWMPLRYKVRAWLDKTQRVIGASPVRGG